MLYEGVKLIAEWRHTQLVR